MKSSTFLHLRISFSFFLLPVFLFAISQSGNINWPAAFLVFLILHFLLYPASNAYNSYFDRDEESIGLMEHPPQVEPELYWAALALDAAAILLGLFISVPFAIGLIIYGLASKAYSHPAIRLKKYPLSSWFIAGFFQGFFVYLMVVYAVGEKSLNLLTGPEVQFPALLTSGLLWAAYPMTQIYQHREDKKRGDLTLSRLLGIRGTFVFTATAFALTIVGFSCYFITIDEIWQLYMFLSAMLPIIIYFMKWAIKVWKNESLADFHHTMRLNFISALCLNVCFLSLLLFK